MARTRGTKLPFSVLSKAPTGVDDKGWRYSWNDPRVWSSFDEAFMFTVEETTEVEGLCYVLHPGGTHEEALRLVCLDFDNAVDDDGNIDPELCEFLSELNTFVEMSKNGNGVHAFVLVRCLPFKNALQRPFANCKVDVLCSSQVAVTGTIFSDYDKLREVDFEVIERFQVKHKEEVRQRRGGSMVARIRTRRFVRLLGRTHGRMAALRKVDQRVTTWRRRRRRNVPGGLPSCPPRCHGRSRP